MMGKLRAFGLAFLALLALGALTASAASAADEFHSEGEPTRLTASAESNQVFVTPEREVRCARVSLDNTTITIKTVSEITVHPTYSECEVINKATSERQPADVDFTNAEGKSCDYLFTGETMSSGHSVVHIKCETGGEITVKITLAGLKFRCLSVPAQTPTGGGVVYHNIGEGANREITIETTIVGIEYTVDEHSLCGTAGVGNDAAYACNVIVTGETAGGAMTGIWFE